MKFKRKLAYIVVMLFGMTLLSNFVPAYADGTSPFEVNVTLSGENGSQTITENAPASIGINIQRIGAVQVGQEIQIEIPSDMSDVQIDSTNISKVFTVTRNGNTVILTANANTLTMVNGYMSISGKFTNNNGDNKNSEIIIGGKTYPIKISKASSPNGGGSSSGGSNSQNDGDPWAFVNWGNGIDKNIGYMQNKAESIGVLGSGNDVIPFTIGVNAEMITPQTVITDTLPVGMTVVPGSIEVEGMQTSNNGGQVTYTPIKVNYIHIKQVGNKLEFSGFKKNYSNQGVVINTNDYLISYKGKLSESYFANKFKDKIINIATIPGKESKASIIINTTKKFNPNDENGMITKTSNANVFTQKGQKIQYTVVVNPNCDDISNVSVVDQLPKGLTLYPNPSDMNYGALFAGAWKNGSGMTDYQVNVVSLDGQESVIMPHKNPMVTITYNLQKNQITMKAKELTAKIVVIYTGIANGKSNNITNTATIQNNGLKDSASATSQYFSNSGSLQAWKTANGKKGTITVTNDMVNYQIHVISHGNYPDGYVKIKDPLQAGIKLESIQVQKKAADGSFQNVTGVFSGNTVGNTVELQNNKYINNNDSYVINLHCSLAAFENGAVIDNTAYVNGTPTNKVVVDKKQPTDGKISVIKKDAQTGAVLKGAVFNIVNDKGTTVGTMTTDASGVATSEGLPLGTYTLKEAQAPTGYDKAPDKTVNVTESGKTYQVDIQDNEAQGTLNITKTNSNGIDKLQGAKFEITNTKSNKTFKATTDASGVASFKDLPWGTYTVKETGAPEGYSVNKNIQSVVIGPQSNGQIVLNQAITVKDSQMQGSIKVVKTDKQTSKVLQGATFTATCGDKTYTETTNAKGVAEFTNLPWGTYKVQETKAPNGYDVNTAFNNNAKDNTVTINSDSFQDGVFKQPVFNVSDNEGAGTLNITKTGENGAKLQGATFVITNSATGKTFTETTDINGVASFKDLAWGTYSVKETVAPKGYTIAKNISDVTIGTQKDGSIVLNQDKTVTDSQIEGMIKIVKTDAQTGKALQGATFTVTNEVGKVVATLTTDKDGIAQTGNLPFGKYVVKETKAPNGYKIAADQNVNINESGKTYGVKFKDNEVNGSLNITKTGKDGVKLQGATFVITNNATGKTFTETTDTNGVADFANLPWGTYKVQETVAPKGYDINKNIQPVVIGLQANGTVVLNETTTVSDSQVQGSIKVVKTDAQTGKALQGATFTATSRDKTYTETTNAEGVAEFTNLPWGTYKVQETKAPNGYDVNVAFNNNAKDNTVTINKDSFKNGVFVQPTFNVNDNESAGSLNITKTGVNGAKLQGAKFEITNTKTSKSFIATTDANGIASFKDLAWGTYTVKETVAPIGYNLAKDIPNVTIGNQGNNTIILNQDKTVTDSQIEGMIKIVKTDAQTGKALQGATFTVTNETGKVVATLTTNKDGITQTGNLPFGKYTVKETKAPFGYAVAADQSVNISENGMTYTKNFSDNEVNGSLNITKTGKDGIKLQGAIFEITNTKTNKSFTETTGVNGIASFKDLAWGTYSIKETKAPAGYDIAKNIKSVVVGAQENGKVILNQVTTVSDSQIQGSIKVIKTDKQTGKALQGATFTATSGDKTYTEITNAEGVAEFTNLPWGTYKVQETKAPNGYDVNTAFNNNAKDNTVTINKDSFKNGVFVQPTFNVNDNESAGSLNITKTGVNGAKLQGAKFEITNTKTSKSFTATTDANGIASFKDLAWGTYTVKETVAPIGYNLAKDIPNVTIGNQGNNTIILNQDKTVSDSQISGMIKIVKTDAQTGKALQGATFTVTNEAGKVVATLTTNKDGIAQTGNLPFGKYTVKETKAPFGYAVAADQSVNISENGKTYTKNFGDNEVSGSLNITKTGVDGVKLQGAKFEITNTKTGKSFTEVTATNGMASFKDLAWGTYTVKELVAPVGYNLAKDIPNVTIGNQGNNTIVLNQDKTVTDSQIEGMIKIVKTDAQTGKALQGATFTVTNSAGKVVATLTTNKDGIAQTGNLPFGKYTVKETKAPFGYAVAADQSVNISENGKTYGVNFKDNEVNGSLNITKTGVNGAKLQGAKFEITNTKTGKTFTATTDKTGVASFKDLAWGTYTVKELVAPVGYNLAKDISNVTIGSQKDGTVVLAQSKTVTDSQIEGMIKIVKTDAQTGKALQGATFTVTNSAGKVVATLTTNKDGIAMTTKLPYGKYVVKEIKAPNGYTVAADQNVNITENNKTYTQDFKDNEISGSLNVTKTGNGDVKLQGATFVITNEATSKSYTEVTNKDGLASFKNLPWGTYKVQETVAPTGYYVNKDIKPITIGINNSDNTGSLEIVKSVADTQVLGKITIHKVGNNGLDLSGATFEITGPNGYKNSVVTGTNGTVTVENLPWGTYKIKETEAPVGYTLNSKVQEVKIDAQTVSVGIGVNTKPNDHKVKVVDIQILGSLKVTKTDMSGKTPLEGAVFSVTGPKNFKEVITTNKDGVAKLSNLEWGKYTVKEIKAPIGYALNSKEQVVEINAKDAAIEQDVQVKDTQILGQIQITKTSENGLKLEGAVFNVTGPNNFNENVTTDSNGNATLQNLQWGTYTVKEVQAPTGYNLNPNVETINVTKDTVGQVQSAVVKDTQINGMIQVTKESSETGAKLQGATFSVINQKTGEVVENITTDTNGIATTKALPYGKYLIKEIKAPTGYTINQNEQTVVVAENGKTYSVLVKDNMIPKKPIEKINGNTNSKTNGATNPKTGDPSEIPLVFVMLLSIAGVFGINKRKRVNN